MATKHTIVEEDWFVILLWNMVATWNMKVIVAMMNIQALLHLEIQGTAMILMVRLLKVLVTSNWNRWK